MWGRTVKIVLSLPFLIVAGLFGFYLLFGYFLVDPLAKKILPWVGENKLASQLSVQKVKFDPLTLEATVEGLALAERGGEPLAGFDRLYVNLDTGGLFRWAWRIRDVELDGPHATVLVRQGGRLNWADLVDKLNEDKEPPSDTLPRLLVDRLRIAEGRIEHTDANRVGEPFRVVLEPLGLELDGLSTLPEDLGSYLVAAKLPEHGGTLKWKGEVGLNPLMSNGEIALEGVRLTNLLRVVRSPRNFELPSGTLGAGLNYRFAMVRDASGSDVPSLQVEGAQLLLQDLALAPRGGGAPKLTLPEARISDGRFDLLKREVAVATVSLAGGRVWAARDVKGELDWQALFAPVGEPAAKPALAPGTPPAAQPAKSNVPGVATPAPAWKIGIGEVRLADWAVRFADRGFAPAIGIDIDDINLSAALSVEVASAPMIEVKPLNLSLGPVQMRSGSRTVAELKRAALVNAKLLPSQNRMDVEAVELSGAKTTLSLEKDGQLNWNAILQKAPGAPPAPAAAPAKTKAIAAGKPPMDLHLARLSLDGIEVGIVDHSPAVPVRLDLERGFVAIQDIRFDMDPAVPLKNLQLDMDHAVPLKAGFALRQGGRVDASGRVIPGKATGKLDVKAANVSLRPFAPYVNRFARLELRSGAASSRGSLSLARAKTGTGVTYRGAFSVDDLAITEEETAEAFLGWKKLSSDSLDFSLHPNRLHFDELVAQNPFGKIVIFEDQSINLKRILRDQGGAARGDAAGKPDASAAKEPASVADAPAAAAEAAFPVAVERIRIVDANLDFADLSLTPQFGALIHTLSGVINGLSTDPGATAQVELDGQVDDYGSTRIRGSLKPFRPTEFTDLALIFRNLEMTRLTPYSGKFAGRRIDSGKLSVDLEYKIKDRQLAGKNKFVVNRLRLGENVDSPSAMRLPLDLAIALLEDSNGIIDLDLPVSGSLDDPKFSYGAIIWKAVVNVLTKLVTAPFRAIGALLGISSEKLEAIGFDPGSDALLPPEREKLKALGDAMGKRPALTLQVEPAFDPVADTRAIQEWWIRRDVAQRKGVKLMSGEPAGPIDLANEKTQKALMVLAEGRFKKEQLAKWQEAFAKPRVDGRTLHAELLEQLTLQIPVTEAELVRLAGQRGAAVKEALAASGVAADRVSIATPVERDVADRVVAAKMTLGAGKLGTAAPAQAETPAAAAP
jgi:uncharacterized protein involved in outer membrane biogenesis